MSDLRSTSRFEGFGRSVAGEFWYECVSPIDESKPSDLPVPAPIHTILLIHGGPGFTSYYLEPLLKLGLHIRIVRYDQAGCGRARRDGARRDFTVAGYVAELEAVRAAVGVERVHLFGHSFGGLVAGEYLLQYPDRVSSIIFASASIDIPRWRSDAERLRSTLPLMTKMVLREGDRSGNYSSPTYLAALAEYYDRFVNRFLEKPEIIRRAESEADSLSYSTMWGPNELVVNGVVRDYDLTPRLSSINVPALCVCGRFDEATPEAHQYFASLIPGARLRVFEESAHHPHINETESFLMELSNFLRF